MSFTVVDHGNKNVRTFGSRQEAEDKAAGIKQMVDAPGEIEVVQGSYESYTDYEHGSQEVDPEIVDHSPGQENTDVPTNPDVTDDPVDWMPSHFIDKIQGVPTVNRKGYAVIAAQYGVSVVAEPVVRASETDFQHAEFKAIATTQDGQEYSGFGSAHVDRMDGDDPYLLNELAETRALKRATSWATGIGMTAIEEMQNDL